MGRPEVKPLELAEVPFEAQLAFETELENGRYICFTDHASAGKNYDKKIAVWLPCSGGIG